MDEGARTMIAVSLDIHCTASSRGFFLLVDFAAPPAERKPHENKEYKEF
jgi:hypothetical protein